MAHERKNLWWSLFSRNHKNFNTSTQEMFWPLPEHTISHGQKSWEKISKQIQLIKSVLWEKKKKRGRKEKEKSELHNVLDLFFTTTVFSPSNIWNVSLKVQGKCLHIHSKHDFLEKIMTEKLITNEVFSL